MASSPTALDTIVSTVTDATSALGDTISEVFGGAAASTEIAQPEVDVSPSVSPVSSVDSDFESDDEDYSFAKFDEEDVSIALDKYHPELKQQNYNEIGALTKVVINDKGNVIDPIHRTLPFLTKFERARVLGLRAKQLNDGASPFIEVPTNVIESYVIAEMELDAKVLPFIISRPLPNGRREYWKLKDLDIIDY